LAQKAGVSQSLIAKIESGKVEPTFTKAQKIFEALDELREKEETKAKQIMNKRVFFVDINLEIPKVISLMKIKGISQVPVKRGETVCGLISEGTILNEMVEHPAKIHSMRAGDVMEDAPPIISIKTGIQTVSELLRNHPIILVAEKGDIQGIISKSDLLESI
jgi:predicted transcriptional regulator